MAKAQAPSIPARPADGPEVLDFRACKRTFARILPPNHPLRIAIAGEPDFVPRLAGLARVEAYTRMVSTLEA